MKAQWETRTGGGQGQKGVFQSLDEARSFVLSPPRIIGPTLMRPSWPEKGGGEGHERLVEPGAPCPEPRGCIAVYVGGVEGESLGALPWARRPCPLPRSTGLARDAPSGRPRRRYPVCGGKPLLRSGFSNWLELSD
ncbi:hypothetical protein LX36DRAFT_328191 [Colletotrichum falcatum]|nr:hypothetical protein LX36DRAFT_328191 [Colletotrichum falcatum]